MTKQEMFNKAYIGLRAQEWRQAVDTNGAGACTYLAPNGDRCAFGHVDPEGTVIGGKPRTGTVWALRSEPGSIVPTLSSEEFEFAQRLQRAHDAAGQSYNRTTEQDMEYRFEELAREYGLTIPH